MLISLAFVPTSIAQKGKVGYSGKSTTGHLTLVEKDPITWEVVDGGAWGKLNYKVKKGKQERYVKDDTQLNDYLLQMALDNAGLHVNADAPAITGTALESMAKQFMAVMNTLKRLSRQYPGDLLEKILYMPQMTQAMMQDPAQAEAWFQ